MFKFQKAFSKLLNAYNIYELFEFLNIEVHKFQIFMFSLRKIESERS
jgi:hypothetical protein